MTVRMRYETETAKLTCDLCNWDITVSGDRYWEAVHQGYAHWNSKHEADTMKYDGTFDLKYLRPGETVRAGPDGGCVITVSPVSSLYVPKGNWLSRDSNGILSTYRLVSCDCHETFTDGTIRHTCPPAKGIVK